MTTTTKPARPYTRRRIAHTTAYAVTEYRSADGTVRDVHVYTADGVSLGRVHWQPKRRARTAGYTMERSPSFTADKWPNLTQYALEMGARLGLDVTA